jgi:hypothetical protein
LGKPNLLYQKRINKVKKKLASSPESAPTWKGKVFKDHLLGKMERLEVKGMRGAGFTWKKNIGSDCMF